MSNSSSRHVFEVLRFVSAAAQPVSVTEVSRSLGLATTTAHRALATLEQAGYIARYQASARYVMGPMVQGLLAAFFARFSLRDLAMPYMRNLALLTGESVSLMVPVGWYGVRIAHTRGMKEVIHTGALGEARPLADGFASGALLSTFPDAQIDEILRTDPARCSAEAGRAVWQDIAGIRRRGFASAEMSIRPGFAAIAIPLRGNEPIAVGAIAIEGPVVEMKPEKPLPLDWLRIIGEMEAHVRANPQRFVNHYAHIDPRSIAFLRVRQATEPLPHPGTRDRGLGSGAPLPEVSALTKRGDRSSSREPTKCDHSI